MKIFVVALLICPFLSYSQSNDSILTDSVFTIVDQPASFPGGLEAWGKYLGKTMRYPKKARKKGIEGRVFVQFIVEKDGSISNVSVVKGIGTECDQETVRVLRSSPNWIPGRDNGELERQKMIQNVLFKFNNSRKEKEDR